MACCSTVTLFARVTACSGGQARDRADGKQVIKRLIALGQDWKSSDMALVAFVQTLRTGAIYEGLSAPVCTNL